ncbi:6-pyruvoyl tetrahydrobiopterin synthase [Bacillus sp. FJAT-27916]|uniref:6-pyruvoyl trahydropterin synthase family protein n=1 Tax=Bacillaceae TaxID=186817 RepID=UPI00067091E2|nr:6-carboxytetrahydropterin synthase [Bacillus sp. FJAT-27916]KMY45292.1 6-pyruvoyl tetrahydrobiopterin synthase [Bacillus sp. FJAT-27916]
MFILKSEIQFDTAHYLSGYTGKCANLHGHRYRVIAKVASESLHAEGQLRGMVEDFGTIKQALREIEKLFDHKLLIEDNAEGQEVARQLQEGPTDFDLYMVPYRPTAEEMSRHIYQLLKKMNIQVCEVEVFETPTNSCTYSEGSICLG